MLKKVIKVPYIDQTKEWPTGCESVSAVMLLQYLGIDITVEEFVERHLERKPLFEKDGRLYGADPRKVFVGSPADENSMGCYAPVIRKALKGALCRAAECGTGLRGTVQDVWEPVDLTGVPVEVLLREYINNDMPVIFWTSIDLKETYAGPEWIVADTGETFEWRSNEHCMLLVGYDEENYYFNDPWHNHGLIGYGRKLVEKRHAEQYEMAVSVRKERKEND